MRDHIVAFLLAISLVTIAFWGRPSARPLDAPVSLQDTDNNDNNNNKGNPAAQNGAKGSMSDEEVELPDDMFSFTVSQPPQGTYIDELKMNFTSTMNFMGMDTVASERMEIVTKRIINDIPAGGQSVDMITTHAFIQETTDDVIITCDSDNTDDTASRSEEEALFCDVALLEVSKPSHFLVDKDGMIIDARGPTAETAEKLQSSSKSQISDRLQDTSRTLNMLPHGPVKMNESWDISVDMGQYGNLKGLSTLTGFTHFDGINCAVVETTGSLHSSQDKLEDLIGESFDQLNDLGESFTIGDAKFQSTLYWSEDHQSVVWNDTSMSLLLTATGLVELKMPIEEKMTLKTTVYH